MNDDYELIIEGGGEGIVSDDHNLYGEGVAGC